MLKRRLFLPLRSLCRSCRQELRGKLDRAETPKSPFTRATGLPRLGAHRVRPEIVVQVAFIEWTPHGKLRHSRLVGIRHDKLPLSVLRETS